MIRTLMEQLMEGQGSLKYFVANISTIQVNLTSGELYEESCLLGFIKVILLGSIIVAAVGGNLLVILSVCRYQSLRTRANTFIVSLAFADLLVALLVMPFSASQEIAQRFLKYHFLLLLMDEFKLTFKISSTVS